MNYSIHSIVLFYFQYMQQFLKILVWCLFIAAIYFPIFLHLDMPPIKVWDESLFAMRAYHFAETGTYLDNFSAFPGLVKYLNLKPPLGTIIQASFFKLLGVSELSLRLPTAFFALGICYLLLTLSKQLTQSVWTGVIAIFILLTTPGFVGVHVLRTGDQDVMVCFWMLLQLFYFFRYTKHKRKNDLYGLVLASLLGFLTKSIFAFFWFPAFASFLILRKQLLPFMRRPQLWYALSTLLVGVLTYYWIMDSLFEGFFSNILDTVLGRYTITIDQHQHPFSYYFKRFYQVQFVPWLWLLPIALFFHFGFYKKQLKAFHGLLWLCMSIHLLVISLSKTKLEWYDAAVFPLAAMIIALAFRQIWLIVFPYLPLRQNPILPTFVKILATALIFAIPYHTTIKSIYYKKWEYDTDIFAYQMKKLAIERPELKDYIIYCGSYDGQVGFYTRFWNEKKAFDIKVAEYWKEDIMQQGTYVLSCYREKIEKVKEEYKTETISTYEKCQVLHLLEAR